MQLNRNTGQSTPSPPISLTAEFAEIMNVSPLVAELVFRRCSSIAAAYDFYTEHKSAIDREAAEQEQLMEATEGDKRLAQLLSQQESDSVRRQIDQPKQGQEQSMRQIEADKRLAQSLSQRERDSVRLRSPANVKNRPVASRSQDNRPNIKRPTDNRSKFSMRHDDSSQLHRQQVFGPSSLQELLGDPSHFCFYAVLFVMIAALLYLMYLLHFVVT